MIVVEYLQNPLATCYGSVETVFSGDFTGLQAFLDKECTTVLPELRSEVVNMALLIELGDSVEHFSEHYRVSVHHGRHIRQLCDQ